MNRHVQNRDLEKGSALLIVFVFAAIIAIMLYRELPVSVFEARRQKEQLLVDRGNEYVHAIRLYVRKIGRYPASIEALEDTNRMRFLRHKFKDPFTGKDDWRLLHAGPGGMLLDSKVTTPGQLFPNGQTSESTPGSSSSSFESTPGSSSSSFGRSAFSSPASNGGTGTFGSSFGSSSSPHPFSSSSSKDAPEVVVPPLPQRPPAIAANGAGPARPGNAAEGDLSSGVAPTPDEVSQQAQQELTVTANPAGEPGGSNANAQQQANGTPPAGNGAGNQAGAGNALAGGANASANGFARPSAGAGIGGGVAAGFTGGAGATIAGGVAGVASKAQGPSIKVVNDQTDYSLWEFYYNPQNDTSGGLGVGALPGNAPQPGTAPQNGNTSTFGQPTGSSFGSASGASTPAPPGGAAPQNGAVPQSAVPAGPPE